MSNSVDNVSSSNFLSPTEQTSKVKDVAGYKDKDVDKSKSQSVEAHKTTGTDEIVLTESAQKLQAIEAELESVPVTNKAKIESVQARIADGSYEVDAESIAEKLLATDTLLT